jgi:hypothetical protein
VGQGRGGNAIRIVDLMSLSYVLTACQPHWWLIDGENHPAIYILGCEYCGRWAEHTGFVRDVLTRHGERRLWWEPRT